MGAIHYDFYLKQAEHLPKGILKVPFELKNNDLIMSGHLYIDLKECRNSEPDDEDIKYFFDRAFMQIGRDVSKTLHTPLGYAKISYDLL